MLKKLIIRLILITFFFASIGPLPDASAQTMIDLPAPGVMVSTSNSFDPFVVKGILVNVKNPLRFDFLVDKGDSSLHGQSLKDEIIRSAKYFLTCLAVPEEDLWVNLSPYEKDRIVPGNFGITLMGKDLLEQDYLLKQIMASLSYPENELGKKFWQKVYRKAYELYGTTNIPINTFNKVWILPKSADVYVQGNSAFVVNSQLDVMLEADYKAMARHQATSQSAGAYSQVFRDVILPELRQEINEGKNFAVVRQVYNAMILATWYKKHLKDSLLGKLYVGKNQVKGVDIADKNAKQEIFQQYLRAYKKCVYNYIKEDYDPMTQQTVPRKYASGGIIMGLRENFGVQGTGVLYREVSSTRGMRPGKDWAMATVDIATTDNTGKILAANSERNIVSFPDSRLLTHDNPLNVEERVGDAPSPAMKSNPINDMTIDKHIDSALLAKTSPAEEKTETVEARPTVEFRPTRWMDKLGWGTGMALAVSVFANHPIYLLGYFLILPFITRLSYGTQVLNHEAMGHAAPDKQPHRWGNLNKEQWKRILLPWRIPQKGDDPFISVVPGEAWDAGKAAKGFYSTVGFGFVSTAATLFIGMHYHWFLPFLGPVVAGSLGAIKASWSEDIDVGKQDLKIKYNCGNFGVFWVGSPQEGVNPSWLKSGLDGLLRKLIGRGGQSGALAAIINGMFSKNGKAALVMEKVVKNRVGPGSDLVNNMLDAYAHKAPDRLKVKEAANDDFDDEDDVYGVNGHVRYTTSGPVSKEATHPFVGPQEERYEYVLNKAGKFVSVLKNFFMLITHNGDNDRFYLLDRYLELDEMRELFPALVHMKKNVWIPPDPESGKAGYWDYFPEGDSPIIAAQMHLLLRQRSWRAAVRYSNLMVNYKTADELLAKIRENKYGKGEGGEIISIQDEDTIAGLIEKVFLKHASKLEREGISNYKDLWVTPRMAANDSSLQNQLDKINDFKKDLYKALEEASVSDTDEGRILKEWNQTPSQRREFVDKTVEGFFTGDRWHAVEEFRLRADGSYGLVVRTSVQNNGATIYSRAQGMAVGWNLKSRFFAFASDPGVLQGQWGDRGRLDQLLLLNPGGSGEVVDVGFKSKQFYLRVYSTDVQRDLSLQDIADREYLLNKSNPYYTEPIEYADTKRMIDDDLEHATEELAERENAWKDPKSFDRRTMASVTELFGSRYVERYLKKNSQYFGVVRPTVKKRLKSFLRTCEGAPGTCSEEQMEYLIQETSASAGDSVMAGYIQNKAEIFLAQQADEYARILVGRINSGSQMRDEDLEEYSEKVDERLKIFLNTEIRRVIADLTKDFEGSKIKWEKEREMYPHTNVSKRVELCITGYEKSYWMGKILEKMLLVFFPNMDIEVPTGNNFVKHSLDYGIHRRSIGWVNTASGQTSPSLAAADILNKMTYGNTIITTSRMDSVANIAIGQGLNPKSPFKCRTFLLGRDHPAESAPTTDVLLYAEQILIVVNLVKQLKAMFPNHKPWGLDVSEAEINRLEEMVPSLVDDSRRITAFDENHQPIETKRNIKKALVGAGEDEADLLPKPSKDTVDQKLAKRGRYKANHLIESPAVNFMFRLFVIGVYFLGHPIQKIMAFLGHDPGQPLSGWTGNLVCSVDVLLALSVSWLLSTFIYRSWSHRPRWARMGAPAEVIGDMPGIHEIVEQFVSKLGAMSIGSMTIPVFSGDPADHFGALYAHRIVPGTQIVVGIPVVDLTNGKPEEVTLKQAKGIVATIMAKYFKGGAEITTISRTDFNNSYATHHHINIGGNILRPDDSDTVKKFYNVSFDPFGRLLAYKVFYNAMFAKASTITIVPAKKWKLGLVEINVKSYFLQIWNRAFSFPSIARHTTRSPIGVNNTILKRVYDATQHHLDTVADINGNAEHQELLQAPSESLEKNNNEAMTVPDFLRPLMLPINLGLAGYSMTLPAGSDEEISIQDAAMSSQVQAVIRKSLIAIAVVAAIGVSAPSAKAATFESVAGGTKIQVTVGKYDTFGKILLDAGYTKKNTRMHLWGQKGVVAEVGALVKAKVPNVNVLYDGEKFVIPTVQNFRSVHSSEVRHVIRKIQSSQTKSVVKVRNNKINPPTVSSASVRKVVKSTSSVKQGHNLTIKKSSVGNNSLKRIPAVTRAPITTAISQNSRLKVLPLQNLGFSSGGKVSAGSSPPPPLEKIWSEFLKSASSQKNNISSNKAISFVRTHGELCIGLAILGIVGWGFGLKLRKKRIRQRIADFQAQLPPAIMVVPDPMPLSMTPEEIARSSGVNQAMSVMIQNKRTLVQANLGTHVASGPGGIDMNSRWMKLNVGGDDQASISSYDNAMSMPIIQGVVPKVSQIVAVTPEMLKTMLGAGYLN